MSTAPPVPSDASVNYTVKDLIGRVEGKLDILIAKVDDKAGRDYVERVESRIEASATLLELRVAALETELAAVRAVSTTTRWLLVTAIPVVTAGVGFLLS